MPLLPLLLQPLLLPLLPLAVPSYAELRAECGEDNGHAEHLHRRDRVRGLIVRQIALEGGAPALKRLAFQHLHERL